MKHKSFFLIAALAATLALHAQQISVVAPGGATKIFTDLNLAIQGADAGSTIYLSGGGFQVNDTTKIKKKLTIMGIGHRPNNDNVDGNTNVSGNFWFEGGSDNSSVMGLYLSGNVNIGTTENAVSNFLLRYCNVNSVQVGNSNCQGIKINQNYIRNVSHSGDSPINFTNNILHSLRNINGGVINNNIIRHNIYHHYSDCAGCPGIYCNHVLLCVNSTQIKNNIFCDPSGGCVTNECIVSNNVYPGAWGDNCVTPEDWDSVFMGVDNGVNPSSDFRLKPGKWKTGATDGGEIGIYGGTGFSDTALPPGPRIVKKHIADQTDENGNLRVQIEVKVQ